MELALGSVGPEGLHARGCDDVLQKGPPQTGGVWEEGPLQHVGASCGNPEALVISSGR